MEFIGRPMRFGRQKKPKPLIKDTLTEAEVTKLIFSCKSLKEKAAVALLAYSGIRNKELCCLRIRDFDPGRNTVRIIKGKGLKDGISSISAECTRILIDYMTQYKKADPADFMFRTYQGNQFTGSALRKLVHVVAHRAGIGKRVYPHLLRHSLSVNMLIRGAHVVLLQRQLRHTLLETTMHYINSIVFGERNDYDKFSPSYL
jgi:site-specific recombinase XerD